MSNWLFAYGWNGHLITNSSLNESNAADNVIAIPRLTFERLLHDVEDAGLDPRIEARLIGRSTARRDIFGIATGNAFSEGWECYGTVFHEAEMLASGDESVDREDRDRDYLEAMREIYGLDLPPCRLMVGASSEH